MTVCASFVARDIHEVARQSSSPVPLSHFPTVGDDLVQLGVPMPPPCDFCFLLYRAALPPSLMKSKGRDVSTFVCPLLLRALSAIRWSLPRFCCDSLSVSTAERCDNGAGGACAAWLTAPQSSAFAVPGGVVRCEPVIEVVEGKATSDLGGVILVAGCRTKALLR